MQRRRNIKLFIILLLAIVASAAAYFATREGDKLSVSRDKFSYQDPSEINRVVFTTDTSTHSLTFEGHEWLVDQEYKADASRISVLFAILKQMRVRRQVSKQQQERIAQKLEQEGVKVDFYEGDKLVHQFFIAGDEESSLTYVAATPEEQAYIVEIPGYRNFLAGIFQLDKNGWRDPLVFDINWSNLSQVRVIYPDQQQNSFNVTYDDPFYRVSEVEQTDSTKLVDFLDEVSLLYVNDYLNEHEEQKFAEYIKPGPQAAIQVEDVGNNVYTLEIYDNLPNGKEIIGRIDSTHYAVFNVNMIRSILRPARFFEEKETGDIK